MSNIKRVMWAAVLCLAVTLIGAGAALAGQTAIYDWPGEDAVVLVQNDSGLILIDTEGQPLRVFSWDTNEGEHDQAVRLVDMSGDGTPEIVGSGTPTFLLDVEGDPQFSLEEGCRQVVVEDLIRGTDKDLICVRRDEMRVYAGNGQFAWSIRPGRNLDRCKTGDITHDGRADIECKYQGSDQLLRLRADGEILSADAEEQRFEGKEESIDEYPAIGDAVWTGGESFDLDGDGNASETIHAIENGLEIRKTGAEDPLAVVETNGTALGAVVKDLDGEGSLSIVAVTSSRIYVIKEGGGELVEVSADASDYSRIPFAELASVYASGFGDADSEARDAVEAVQDDISACYGARLRASPYAGSGRQLMQVTVGEDGSVQQVQQRHSAVGDDGVESCARNAVENAQFPAPEGEQGTVNVNVIFTFRDEEG